jgi:uncharacterized integral membrane protein (TIGR00698 family)
MGSDEVEMKEAAAIDIGAEARRSPFPTTAPSSLSNEDWLAVWVAFLSIALVLVGIRPALPASGWTGMGDLASTVIGGQNVLRLAVVGAGVGALSAAAISLMDGSAARFLIAFPALYALATLAQIVAGNTAVSAYGIEYVIVAVGIGMAISNVTGVPAWLKNAVRTEFYIKTGLVILGTSIVFGDVMRAGLLGIAQALLVVTAVWFFCFWLARRLRVDDELATMLATAVSICGVSAAIAACGAIQGDRKKLSYVTSLVILVAAPMIVIMPQLIVAFGIPDVVGGAWLGGTLDTSASVVAAAEIVSAPARDAGVIVKLSQNVLIGVAAFFLTIWWALRDSSGHAVRPGVRVIWERFPKFVIGFLVASLTASFLLPPAVLKETQGIFSALRTVWFALAFTSIGLETRFGDLVTTEGGRPALAFLGGQAFNVVWTLILAYLLFGGIFFAAPSFR